MINLKQFVPRSKPVLRKFQVSHGNKLFLFETEKKEYLLKDVISDFIGKTKGLPEGTEYTDFEVKHLNLYNEYHVDALDVFDLYPDNIMPEFELIEEELNLESLKERLCETELNIPVDYSVLVSKAKKATLKVKEGSFAEIMLANFPSFRSKKQFELLPIDRKPKIIKEAFFDSETGRVIPIVSLKTGSLQEKIEVYDSLRRAGRLRKTLKNSFQYAITRKNKGFQILVFKRRCVGEVETQDCFGKLPEVSSAVEVVEQLKQVLETPQKSQLNWLYEAGYKDEEIEESHEGKELNYHLREFLAASNMTLEEYNGYVTDNSEPRI